ncbi:MAG TPA: RNHCP domain-containing protein [Patescibacteria group bacterium]|nr:RNHCP domain-containing protein [Patescibacteria group bacterium]
MFLKNNQEFVCVNCGKEVAKHPTSSRNHCNYCLTGLHVDIEPGDRKNTCGGLLEPIGIETAANKTQIIFKCQDCGITNKNIAAPDDNQELIIELCHSTFQ